MGQLASLAGCVYKLAAATELIELSESRKLVLHVICLKSGHLLHVICLISPVADCCSASVHVYSQAEILLMK